MSGTCQTDGRKFRSQPDGSYMPTQSSRQEPHPRCECQGTGGLLSQGKSSRAVDYLVLNLMVAQTIITLKEYDFEHQNNIYGLASCCALDLLGQKGVFKIQAEHLEVHLLGKSLKGIAHLGESLYCQLFLK